MTLFAGAIESHNCVREQRHSPWKGGRSGVTAQYLRRSGGCVETLKTMLGHNTLDMNLHYARITGIYLATAHETADPVQSLRLRL